MKKTIPWLVLLATLALVGVSLVPPHNPAEFDVTGFGRLPVLVNGRIKPFDTVARTSLLQFQGRWSVTAPNGSELTPEEWLLDVMFSGTVADAYQTFEIVHPDVLALFSLKPEDGAGKKRFSFVQLEKNLTELERQYKLAEPVESAVRSSFQKAVIQLYNSLVLYQRLQHSLVPPDSEDFLAELMSFQKALPAGVAAMRAKQAGQPFDEAAANQVTAIGEKFMQLENYGYLLAIPPEAGAKDPTAWSKPGSALLETFASGRINPSVLTYAAFARTWRQHQPAQFNELVALYRDALQKRFAPQLVKCDVEVRFNSADPFWTSMRVYIGAFLLALFSWLKWPEVLGRSAFYVVALAWLLATAGIVTRMWLEGRPPVTNLYSSALFVGWGAVALCLVLETIFKNAIGSVAAGLVGFSTLLIAHYLSFSGDTLEMMRAVLDSNFWLATHVVVVATGYAATFLSGFLALIYIFRGVFTRSLDKATADSLARMVYGIVCFATLFSLVGTVLGGIWADQSWGRFWGWDPKENGALIIVIWNAIILHARWGGLVKQRGLMCLAVFGNVVTSWSWFGVNMLGVGLHSYGFMDAAFWWLVAFVASQLVIIGLANLPLEKWRSFQGPTVATPPMRGPMAKAPA